MSHTLAVTAGRAEVRRGGAGEGRKAVPYHLEKAEDRQPRETEDPARTVFMHLMVEDHQVDIPE